VSAADQPIAEHTHPAAGDRLVFAFGDREGRPITPDDVPLGGPLITADPADANGGHVANASRLDQVILLRVDPSTLSEETRARSAEGIVAYSGICTHTGCEVTDWDGVTGRLICPCHDSHFDPADNATVLEGPAPRRLAALPVEIVGGDLRVAGGFVGRLGAQRSGQTSS
jgi:Rieske Fe-S protein